MRHRRIDSVPAAMRTLRNKAAVADLEQAANRAWEAGFVPLPAGEAFVAGRGLDLTGELDCWGWECRLRQATDLAARAFAYFDFAVVEDRLIHHRNCLTRHAAGDPNDDSLLLDQMRLVMRLQRSGADRLLEFRGKPMRHGGDAHEQARSAELPLPDGMRHWVDLFVREANIRPGSDPGAFVLTHNLLEHTQWVTLPDAPDRSEDVRRTVAEKVVDRFTSHFITDMAASRMYRVPLGPVIKMHSDFIGRAIAQSPARVALSLELPALLGLGAEDLIELRAREAESFSRFQAAVRSALRLQADASPDSDATAIARQIEDDVIRPALSEIDRKLTVFEEARKAKALRYLGRTVVSCSLGLASSVVSPLGMVTAMAAIGRDTIDVMGTWKDGRPDVASDDYFILWKAREEHAHEIS